MTTSEAVYGCISTHNAQQQVTTLAFYYVSHTTILHLSSNCLVSYQPAVMLALNSGLVSSNRCLLTNYVVNDHH